MTKAELIERIATNAKLTKADAERALSTVLDTISEGLKQEEKLTLAGFGTFIVESRKERQGRNPRTGEAITIAASKAVKFRPSKQLKETLN